MRAFVVAAAIVSFFVFPGAAQNVELTSRPAAAIDRVLRSSCYCIGCTAADVPDLVAARCGFVRWGAYPFLGAERGEVHAGYAQELEARFATFAAFVAEYKKRRPDGVVEFVLPEIVTEGIQTVRVGNLARPLSRLGMGTVTADDRFSFTDVYDRERGDHFWTAGAEFERNGVPSLRTNKGRLWAAYLAGRAMRAGADAINFAQPQLRVRNSDDLEFTVRKLRTLRSILDPDAPPLLFGTSATHHLRRGVSTFPLSRFIDYAKVKIDIDSYFVQGGVRYVQRHNAPGERCEILGSALDKTLLPTDFTVPDQYLCMLATDRPERPTKPSPEDRDMVSFNQMNPFRLRVLMELDGVQKCSDGTRRVWYYAPDPEYVTDCYAEVRHALPTTMYFLSRSAEARGAFIEYMYRLAQKLTATKGYGVYFPLPIRVDQNKMAFVLEPRDCTPGNCAPACSAEAAARPSQAKWIRGCPSEGSPDGLFCQVAGRQYVARQCVPDLQKITKLLP